MERDRALTVEITESQQKVYMRELGRLRARDDLGKFKGQTWDIDQFRAHFRVIGPQFGPFLAVRRVTDGTWGTIEYSDRPRTYFNYQEIT